MVLLYFSFVFRKVVICNSIGERLKKFVMTGVTCLSRQTNEAISNLISLIVFRLSLVMAGALCLVIANLTKSCLAQTRHLCNLYSTSRKCSIGVLWRQAYAIRNLVQRILCHYGRIGVRQDNQQHFCRKRYFYLFN